MEALRRIFEARSVAVVGASRDPQKRGHQAIRALLESGYRGDIFPVHPEGGMLFDLPVAPTVLDLARVPDVALVCTPADSVPDVLRRCAQCGIGGAVILAVGFGESGENGAALEAEVSTIGRETGLRIVGPNTSGVLNAHLGLNLVGVRHVRPGSMALLSQSGNLGLDLMTRASAGSQGVSLYVGLGNELDVGFHEVLAYAESHEQSRVILVYAEGFRNGRAFMEEVGRVARTKPVVVLKGGRSENGASTARSHTGAVAGSYPVFRSLLRQNGAHEVRRSDELLRVGEMLAGQPPFRADGVVVLADGGGHATLAADALEELGVPLAGLCGKTRTRLARLLGAAAATANPIDLAGAADRSPGVFAQVAEILAADRCCGGIVITGLFGGYALRFDEALATEEEESASAMADIVAAARIPLVLHTIYADSGTEPLARLRASAVPVVESLEVACTSAAAAHFRRAFLERRNGGRTRPSPCDHEGKDQTPADEKEHALTEPEARRLVSSHGIALVPATEARTADECASAVTEYGSPVAVKIVARGIPHKTDAGGVALGVEGPEAGAEAFRTITAAAASYARNRGIEARIEGVLVSPMLPPPLAEMIVGVRADPHFGHVLTVGAGGTSVELHGDVSIRGLPIEPDVISEMLDELRAAALLNGFRGSAPADRNALIALIQGVAACALDHPELEEIELNPVMVYADRALAVDVRAFSGDTGER